MIAAEISVYPLRRTSIGSIIRDTIRILESFDLQVRVSEMSTLVWGEERILFEALEAAFLGASNQGDTVMNITLSNACPKPE